MVARCCSYGSKDLLALGFTKKEVGKYQRIAARYRDRKKEEPDPSFWLNRYRKKLAEGWTWKTKCPDGVAMTMWRSYQKTVSRHTLNGVRVPTLEEYIEYKTEHPTTPRFKQKDAKPAFKEITSLKHLEEVVARNRQIVEEKLRKQGLSLPAAKK